MDCPVAIGSEYEVEIAEIMPNGEGLASVKGFWIFVPKVKVGNKVKVKVTTIDSVSADAEVIRQAWGFTNSQYLKRSKLERPPVFQKENLSTEEDMATPENAENATKSSYVMNSTLASITENATKACWLATNILDGLQHF